MLGSPAKTLAMVPPHCDTRAKNDNTPRSVHGSLYEAFYSMLCQTISAAQRRCNSDNHIGVMKHIA